MKKNISLKTHFKNLLDCFSACQLDFMNLKHKKVKLRKKVNVKMSHAMHILGLVDKTAKQICC